MSNNVDNRPITLRIDEFRKSLDKSIEEAHLPAFILELIWNQYFNNLHIIATDEYASEKEKYLKQTEGEKNV